MPSPNLIRGMDDYTHSVSIGVKLTATVVLLDAVVPTAELITSRAETLQYVTIVSRLMLPFTVLDPRYVSDTGSQLNITFPGEEASDAEICTPLHCLVLLPVGFEHQDKYTLALSQAAVWIKYGMAAWGTGNGDSADTSPRKLHDPRG